MYSEEQLLEQLDDGERKLPRDGPGISANHFRNIIKDGQNGAIARTRRRPGGWLQNVYHPVHVPERLRNIIKERIPEELRKEWLDSEWKQHAPGSEEDKAQMKRFLEVFWLLSRDPKFKWSSGIYARFEEKLSSLPQDCEIFEGKPSSLPPWVGGLRFSIESVRLIYDEAAYENYCSIPLEYECEDFLAFHGTQLAYFPSILKDGFRAGPDGWFGNGSYFTTSIPYALHYVGNQEVKGDGEFGPADRWGKEPKYAFHPPKVGHCIYVLACLLRPGKVKVVPPDMTPPGAGYRGPYRSMNKDRCDTDDFDSHVAYVTPNAPGKGFRPMSQAQIDAYPDQLILREYVMFDPARILPRYIIGVRREEDAKEVAKEGA